MKAKELAKTLRLIADIIEAHPELLEEKLDKQSLDIDIKTLLSFYVNGEATLREYLEKFDIKDLKDIIKICGLDRLRKTLRWRKKEKLINFIVEKTRENYKKGNVFIK